MVCPQNFMFSTAVGEHCKRINKLISFHPFQVKQLTCTSAKFWPSFHENKKKISCLQIFFQVFEIFSQVLACFPGFPWLEKVVSFFQVFQYRWEPCTRRAHCCSWRMSVSKIQADKIYPLWSSQEVTMVCRCTKEEMYNVSTNCMTSVSIFQLKNDTFGQWTLPEQLEFHWKRTVWAKFFHSKS